MSNTQQFVYLIPRAGPQGVNWMWIYNGNFGTGDLPAIVANQGSGPNDITFAIVDAQDAIKFAGYNGPDTNAAISIGEKTEPPSKPTTISTGGAFKSVNLQDATHLKLEDKNNNKKEYVYSLNFVDSKNNNLKVTSIDPEIRNGDGNNVYQIAAIYLGTALIGAALALVFARYVLNWQRVS